MLNKTTGLFAITNVIGNNEWTAGKSPLKFAVLLSGKMLTQEIIINGYKRLCCLDI